MAESRDLLGASQPDIGGGGYGGWGILDNRCRKQIKGAATEQ